MSLIFIFVTQAYIYQWFQEIKTSILKFIITKVLLYYIKKKKHKRKNLIQLLHVGLYIKFSNCT